MDDYLAIVQELYLPHWLIIAGAVLLLIGIIGVALARRKGEWPEA